MARLAREAQRQHGVWTRQQAAAAGLRRADIARHLASGDWVELHPDVFAAASRPVDDRSRLLAACLAVGPHVALAGQAAAFVRRFPGVGADYPPHRSPDRRPVRRARVPNGGNGLSERGTSAIVAPMQRFILVL
jgi:hypothetical protein